VKLICVYILNNGVPSMVDAVCAVQSVLPVRSGFEKTLVANMFLIIVGI